MKKSNQISLKELVLKRRTTLQSEFEHADITNRWIVAEWLYYESLSRQLEF